MKRVVPANGKNVGVVIVINASLLDSLDFRFLLCLNMFLIYVNIDYFGFNFIKNKFIFSLFFLKYYIF